MKPASAAQLADAYTFLRRVEHRIQYLDDQQTHLLPTHDGDLDWIARSLGLVCDPPACGLLDRLGEIRELVATEFDALLHDGRAPANGSGGCRGCGTAPQPIDSEEFLERLPPSSARACGLVEQPKVRLLRDESKLRLARLVARAAKAVADGAARCTAALLFIDWLEPLLRRESYLALLVERPEVQNRLLRLLGLARWPMRYLMLHPGVIDELADERLLHGRFDPPRTATSCTSATPPGSARARPTRNCCSTPCAARTTPRSSARWCATSKATSRVEQVADDLSALADATLDCALGWAWQHLKQAPPQRAAAGGHRLRQARRQGARLRQRPRRRVRLRRRRRGRPRPRRRGLRRLRAQADHLADAAHRGRRAVRHRHRAAPERQLGAAGDVDRLVRELPDRPRQQHRVDLGAPGADARALVRRAGRAGAARSRRCGARCCARRATPRRCAPRSSRCARRCATRARCAATASTSSTAPAA